MQLNVFNSYTFATWWCKPLFYRIVWNILRFTTLSCKIEWIRKSEFVTNTYSFSSLCANHFIENRYFSIFSTTIKTTFSIPKANYEKHFWLSQSRCNVISFKNTNINLKFENLNGECSFFKFVFYKITKETN